MPVELGWELQREPQQQEAPQKIDHDQLLQLGINSMAILMINFNPLFYFWVLGVLLKIDCNCQASYYKNRFTCTKILY